MPKFRVFHNYGCEGWKAVNDTDFDDILDAVKCREIDIASCGGEVIVVEVIETLEAYRRADYARDDLRRRQAAGK